VHPLAIVLAHGPWRSPRLSVGAGAVDRARIAFGFTYPARCLRFVLVVALGGLALIPIGLCRQRGARQQVAPAMTNFLFFR